MSYSFIGWAFVKTDGCWRFTDVLLFCFNRNKNVLPWNNENGHCSVYTCYLPTLCSALPSHVWDLTTECTKGVSYSVPTVSTIYSEKCGQGPRGSKAWGLSTALQSWSPNCEVVDAAGSRPRTLLLIKHQDVKLKVLPHVHKTILLPLASISLYPKYSTSYPMDACSAMLAALLITVRK